jgi:hypothetical protein
MPLLERGRGNGNDGYEQSRLRGSDWPIGIGYLSTELRCVRPTRVKISNQFELTKYTQIISILFLHCENIIYSKPLLTGCTSVLPV